jgi:hypothetical protein
MGGLVRCEGCGSIMWNVLVRGPVEGTACPSCGGVLKLERRRPGRKFRAPAGERRDLAGATPPRARPAK